MVSRSYSQMIPRRMGMASGFGLAAIVGAVTALSLAGCGWAEDGENDPSIDRLIDSLANVSREGVGFTSSSHAVSFVLVKGSRSVLSAQIPMSGADDAPEIKALVCSGAKAIPWLVKRLDDESLTKIPPIRGKFFTQYASVPDRNRKTDIERTEQGVPVTQSEPEGHRITVGDLCFVALGQIVNRDFSAIRYVPSAGVRITSPTTSKDLCRVLREEYGSMSADDLKRRLCSDFITPDTGWRRIGAYFRLACYFPDEVPSLVLSQLGVEPHDRSFAWEFIGSELCGQRDQKRRREAIVSFLHVYGQGSRNLLLDRLRERVEEEEKYPENIRAVRAEQLLREVLSAPSPESSSAPLKDVLLQKSWSYADRDQFLRHLIAEKDPTIDEAVARLFRGAGSDDLLRLACMERFLRRGEYFSVFRRYCIIRLNEIQRNGGDRHSEVDYRKVLDRIAEASRLAPPSDPKAPPPAPK